MPFLFPDLASSMRVAGDDAMMLIRKVLSGAQRVAIAPETTGPLMATFGWQQSDVRLLRRFASA